MIVGDETIPAAVAQQPPALDTPAPLLTKPVCNLNLTRALCSFGGIENKILLVMRKKICVVGYVIGCSVFRMNV